MLKEIRHEDNIIAIIIRSTYKNDGITFLTEGHFSQQLAYMKRPSGYRISPHIHRKVERNVQLTQEVLFVRKGRVKVDMYTSGRQYLSSEILNTGDVILLASGGHGFTMLEETEMIEVKQGPYAGDDDKERFEDNK
jgi:mannose-6-phosphate isomerase-like protein (cupin superfamily)